MVAKMALGESGPKPPATDAAASGLWLSTPTPNPRPRMRLLPQPPRPASSPLHSFPHPCTAPATGIKRCSVENVEKGLMADVDLPGTFMALEAADMDAGETALYVAVEDGYDEVLRLLLLIYDFAVDGIRSPSDLRLQLDWALFDRVAICKGKNWPEAMRPSQIHSWTKRLRMALSWRLRVSCSLPTTSGLGNFDQQGGIFVDCRSKAQSNSMSHLPNLLGRNSSSCMEW